ncbi:hypothetical protein BDB01DRAFT_853145 [Pilobolus umbonatus]|nr:hypothetical protein BDB01DRAFT_853145 [Pilobolus umbonatus]
MVSFQSLLLASISLLGVKALVSPSYPYPGVVQKEGELHEILWSTTPVDNDQTYTIEFMTGSDTVQTVLATVATNVSADLLKYPYIVPQVTPHSAIYFFKFTGSKGDFAWATRFGITGADGILTPELERTQADGKKIPWGEGKLVGAWVSDTTPTPPAEEVQPAATLSQSLTESELPKSTSVVAKVAAKEDTNASNMMKPVLTCVSIAVAGYFAL